MHKETISVHGGTYHDAATRGINTPIFTSSSYEYMDLDPAQIQPPDFLHRLKLIRPAVSLGGVETIICAPCETSHSKMSAEERQRAGIADTLLRLSVGIEHADDLMADLTQALG